MLHALPPGPSHLARLRGVVGQEEATGGRRLQRDCAPVSAICLSERDRPGRCGPGSSAAPTPGRPGTAGEPGPATEPGRLAPRLRKAARVRSGRRGWGHAVLLFPPSCAHNQPRRRCARPAATALLVTGAGPRVSRAQPGHTPKAPALGARRRPYAPLPAGTRAPPLPQARAPQAITPGGSRPGTGPRDPGRPPPRPLTARKVEGPAPTAARPGSGPRPHPARAAPPGFRAAGRRGSGACNAREAGPRPPDARALDGRGGGAAERASPPVLRARPMRSGGGALLWSLGRLAPAASSRSLPLQPPGGSRGAPGAS